MLALGAMVALAGASAWKSCGLPMPSLQNRTNSAKKWFIKIPAHQTWTSFFAAGLRTPHNKCSQTQYEHLREIKEYFFAQCCAHRGEVASSPTTAKLLCKESIRNHIWHTSRGGSCVPKMSVGITELTTFLAEDPVVGSCSPALGPEFAKAQVQSACESNPFFT